MALSWMSLSKFVFLLPSIFLFERVRGLLPTADLTLRVSFRKKFVLKFGLLEFVKSEVVEIIYS